MREISAAHLAGPDRTVLRDVALAYRRAFRAAQALGRDVWEYEEYGRRAADEKYLELRPETAAIAKLKRSEAVNLIVAAAINVDPTWFWYGPDR